MDLKSHFRMLLQTYIFKTELSSRSSVFLMDQSRFLVPDYLRHDVIDHQCKQFIRHIAYNEELPSWVRYLQVMTVSPQELKGEFLTLLQTYTVKSAFNAQRAVTIMDQALFLSAEVLDNNELTEQVYEFTDYMDDKTPRPAWVRYSHE